ncbi:hypothetical protein pclt_cds_618 [Pandoravirus celtis]|uniref:Uncharacterized protein n=1 Tax=Pandoravirus celtis TaxID=2568002 RepID=A0A4D6EHD0_9VIRU|nr:hypothetical protein pclt_cds_618 [Pandoravirus celtis]
MTTKSNDPTMVDTPDDALRDYAERRKAERDEARRKRAQEGADRIAHEKQRRAECESNQAKQYEATCQLWTRHDPAGKYIRGVGRAIERDAAVQRALTDHIRDTGETNITFLSNNWPAGWEDRIVGWSEYVPKEQRGAMLHQIVHDPDLARKRKIAEGPFAGWTFECRSGWFDPYCRLVDRRGRWGSIKDALL